jgi:diaminohydroxyphosphoribosylaminopyrimidine deaminase / 5-amino-6-(5-phosphoribosylamino)uracil reductase
MDRALLLASGQLGCVAPNPAVGCVIADNETIISESATAGGGRPHAEFQALEKAGSAASGASVYLTLEPCAHEGETPSCARLLVEAGVGRVIIAAKDTDPRTSGAGAEMLRAAGIVVDFDLAKNEALKINQGYFLLQQEARPMVTLKIASSSDAKVARPHSPLDESGNKWITGPAARQHGHYLRASHDAILVGIGTANTDDPMLTCRLEEIKNRSPVRIVLDRNCRLDPEGKLARTANEVPTWIIHQGALRGGLADTGVRSIKMDDMSDISAILTCIGHAGVTRLLVEGGPTVWYSFLKSGLVDHLHWYKAPMVIGAGGLQISDGFSHGQIEEDYGLVCTGEEKRGDDMLVSYEKRR